MNIAQKARTFFSAMNLRNELKGLLIRRYWQTHKMLVVHVGDVQAKFDTSDFLSNALLFQNEHANGYEPAVSALLAKLIKTSKVYADVGGNIGYFSILPALVNPDCKIYYFEMDSSIKPLLLRNIKANLIDENRITIVNAAIGESATEVKYVLHPHPYSFLAKLGNENIDVYDLKLSAKTIRLDVFF